MPPLLASTWRGPQSLERHRWPRAASRMGGDSSMAGIDLVEMLDLETVGPNRFRAQPLAGSRAVVFGGQLLAPSLVAAARSNDGMRVKSMHTVFLRGGRPD